MTVLLLAAVLNSESTPLVQSLDRELRRLGVQTALVLPTSALDESPLWSPDSRYVAGNVAGAWEKVDLEHLRLEPAKWRGGQGIGAVDSKASALEVGLLEAWRSSAESAARRKVTDAFSIEFRHEGLSTALVLGQRGQAPKTLWRSDLENCDAAVFSPDRKYVAFICETNGLFVMLVP